MYVRTQDKSCHAECTITCMQLPSDMSDLASCACATLTEDRVTMHRVIKGTSIPYSYMSLGENMHGVSTIFLPISAPPKNKILEQEVLLYRGEKNTNTSTRSHH